MKSPKVVTLDYRPFKKPHEFFLFGRPAVVAPGLAEVFRRRFDAALLALCVFSAAAVLGHFIIAYKRLAIYPNPSAIAVHDCGKFKGRFDENLTVLRFFNIPYAVPPLAAPDPQTSEVLADLLNLYGPNGGVNETKFKFDQLRWQVPWKINGIEACLLSHHDRCNFAKSQWSCDFTSPRIASHCVQPVPNKHDDFSNSYILFQQEKCLHLHIATPIYNGELKPVIVVLAGFQFLTEPLMPPEYQFPAYWPTNDVVKDSDAVWVYVHYRLGLSGFFYDLSRQTNDSTPDGTFKWPYENFAIQDQLRALEWIHKYIRNFGGDSKKVTLLGHGSGATSGLALLDLQSRQTSKQRLFHQAWLASGAVHWSGSPEGQKNAHIPLQILNEFVKKRLGAHCIVDSKFISNKCFQNKLRDMLLADSIQFLYASLADLLESDSKIVGDVTKENSANAFVRNWISADSVIPIPQPKNWTKEDISRIFIPTSDEPFNLVMTSMSNELEGWASMDDFWLTEDNVVQTQRIINMLNRFSNVSVVENRAQHILDRLWREELSRTAKDENSWPPIRTANEVHQELMSILRYACSHNWLLSKFAATDKQVNVYQVVHTEAPDISVLFVPGPRPQGKEEIPPRRFAFQGLDMMILTGKNVGSAGGNNDKTKNIFHKYKDQLRTAFKKFVHGKNLNDKCKILGEPDSHGCKLNGNGFSRIDGADSIMSICSIVDWDNFISELSVPN